MKRNPLLGGHDYSRFALTDRILRSDLMASDKMVGVYLAQRMQRRGKEAGKAWPGRDVMALALGISERQVSRSTEALEEAGLLRKWRTRYGALYRFNATWDDVPVARAARSPRSLSSFAGPQTTTGLSA